MSSSRTKGLIHHLYGLCGLSLFFALPDVLSLIPLRNLCSGYLIIIFQLHVLRRTNQGGRHGTGVQGVLGRGQVYIRFWSQPLKEKTV